MGYAAKLIDMQALMSAEAQVFMAQIRELQKAVMALQAGDDIDSDLTTANVTVLETDRIISVDPAVNVNALYFCNTTMPIASGVDPAGLAELQITQEVYQGYFIDAGLGFGLARFSMPTDADYEGVITTMSSRNRDIVASPNSFWDDVWGGIKSVASTVGSVVEAGSAIASLL